MLGRVAVPNIDRGLPAPNSQRSPSMAIRSTYQHFLAYRTVEGLQGNRQSAGIQRTPCRLVEIESVSSASFAEELTSGDSYADRPTLVRAATDDKIADVLKQWFVTPRPISTTRS